MHLIFLYFVMELQSEQPVKMLNSHNTHTHPSVAEYSKSVHHVTSVLVLSFSLVSSRSKPFGDRLCPSIKLSLNGAPLTSCDSHSTSSPLDHAHKRCLCLAPLYDCEYQQDLHRYGGKALITSQPAPQNTITTQHTYTRTSALSPTFFFFLSSKITVMHSLK